MPIFGTTDIPVSDFWWHLPGFHSQSGHPNSHLTEAYLITVAEWLAHLTAKQVSHSSLASLPLLKHACRESDWLLCWSYIPAKVSHQKWISGNVYHVPMPSMVSINRIYTQRQAVLIPRWRWRFLKIISPWQRTVFVASWHNKDNTCREQFLVPLPLFRP